MGGVLVRLPARGEILLTKRQLASHLGRSERWVELRVRDGMPVEEATDRYGRRQYNLELVERWLKNARSSPTRRSDRIDALERSIAELAAQVAELREAG